MNRTYSKTSITCGACLYIILTALMLWACGNGTGIPGTAPPNSSPAAGTVAFSVQWSSGQDGRGLKASPSGDVCVDYAIDTIVIEVHDATGQVVNFINRDCTDHQATISKVPTGSGMWLSLGGMVAGGAHWSGQSAVFAVTGNQTTDAGTVSMHYIGDDDVRPQVQATSPADGAVNVSLDAEITVTFDEEMVAASVVPAFGVSAGATAVAGQVVYHANTRTATFTPDTGLPESSLLTARVADSVEDLAGNQLAGEFTCQFTSTSVEAPSATTLTATALTESSATLNGEVNPNGLATTCWFEYGTDTSYGQSTAAVDVGAGRDAQAVSADISGLINNTEYHYRLVAENSGGTGNGADAALNTMAIWARSYGTVNDESGFEGAVQPTTDGGYIVAAKSYVFGTGDIDIWMLKLDAAGDIEWQKTFGGVKQDTAASVQQTSDGGYVVAGHTLSYGAGGSDFWVLKLNADGSTDWTRTYGDGESDKAYDIQQTSDAGFIVAGETQSFGALEAYAWVLKLNPAGDIAWQKKFGGANWDNAYSVRQTSDGGYIVGGRTESAGQGLNDMWIVKLDTGGKIDWQKTYGGSGDDYCQSVRQTPDGGYIAAGSTGSFGAGPATNIWLLKINASGAVEWQKTYGEVNGDLIASIALTPDGGYIVSASTQNFGPDLTGDIWAFKLNADGSIAWEKTYGGPEADRAGPIQPTPDGGYVMIGDTSSFGAGGAVSGDLWILKLGEDGTLGCGLGNDTTAAVLASAGIIMDTSVSPYTTSILAPSDNQPGADFSASIDIQCPQ